MSVLFYFKAAIVGFVGINDAGDALEINDAGDVLLY